jgi:hypothetical protein
MKIRVLLIAITAVSVAALAWRAQMRSPKEDIITTDATWAAGKPHLPIELSVSPQGAVTPDEVVEVSARILPLRDCDGLIAKVRGIGGVEVIDGGEARFASCAHGVPLTLAFHARARKSVAGYLVVELDASYGGVSKPMIRAFPFAANGASFATPAAGEVRVDKDGNSVVVLKGIEKAGVPVNAGR